MHSWGQLWTRYKKTKTQLPLLRYWEQKQGPVLNPCTQPYRGWADYLSHPPAPPLDLRPTLTPFKGPAPHPPTPSKKGNLLLVFSPSCCSTSHNKALPEFLIWPVTNFYWLKSTGTLVCNSTMYSSTKKKVLFLSEFILFIFPAPRPVFATEYAFYKHLLGQ